MHNFTKSDNYLFFFLKPALSTAPTQPNPPTEDLRDELSSQTPTPQLVASRLASASQVLSPTPAAPLPPPTHPPPPPPPPKKKAASNHHQLAVVPFPNDQTVPHTTPLAVAVTETWRAQFPDGGGSSYASALEGASAGRAVQSCGGQVTLAVARPDLERLQRARATATNSGGGLVPGPLILSLHSAARIQKVWPAFSGVQIR